MPAQILVSHPIVQTCARAQRDAVIPQPVGDRDLIQGFCAVCNAAFLNAAGIPSAMYGPGNLLQALAAVEYVQVERLIPAAKTDALTPMDWCGYE